MISRKDFENSLQDPLSYWGKLDSNKVETLLGKNVARMVGFNQKNPHHCYELFDHVLYVVDSIPNENILLRVAAFFHDLGKPEVAFEKQGRLVFYGHPKKSMEMTLPILKQLGYTDEECRLVCFWIEHHDDFISWKLENSTNNRYITVINSKNIRNYVNHSSKSIPEEIKFNRKEIFLHLLKLCQADAKSQAELVFMNEILTDSKEDKLKRLEAIEGHLNRFSE